MYKTLFLSDWQLNTFNITSSFWFQMKHKYLFRFSRCLNAQQYLISQERNSRCHYNSSFTVLGTFSLPLVAWKPFNATNRPSPLTNQYWLPSAQSFYHRLKVSRNFSPVCPTVTALMKRLLPQRYYGPALLTMLLSWHLIDRNKSIVRRLTGFSEKGLLTCTQ